MRGSAKDRPVGKVDDLAGSESALLVLDDELRQVVDALAPVEFYAVREMEAHRRGHWRIRAGRALEVEDFNPVGESESHELVEAVEDVDAPVA